MKKLFVSMGIIMLSMFGGTAIGLMSPQSVSAGCEDSVIGFRPWFYGLVKEGGSNCELKSPTEAGGLTAYIWTIAMNIVDIGLMFVVYASFFFILYGGFLFLISQGKADDIVRAKKSILYAVIGFVVSISAEGIVRFISGRF